MQFNVFPLDYFFFLSSLQMSKESSCNSFSLSLAFSCLSVSLLFFVYSFFVFQFFTLSFFLSFNNKISTHFLNLHSSNNGYSMIFFNEILNFHFQQLHSRATQLKKLLQVFFSLILGFKSITKEKNILGEQFFLISKQNYNQDLTAKNIISRYNELFTLK